MSEQIRVDVVFEPKGTQQSFQKVEKQAKTAGQKASVSFSEGFSKSISKSMANVRSQIVGTVGAFFAFNAVKNTLVNATNAALDFEQAVKEVNTILPKNTKLTEQQTKALRGLATQFGTDASDQVKSYYQVISAGVTNATRATKLLTTANKLAIGGITSVGASIDVLTSIVNGYGQENITSQEAADSLFTAVRLGKTTVDELASSLATVIPGARAAGVNLDTVNASLAVLTANGVETSMAVTKLNSLFNAIAANGKKLGEGMDSTALKTDGLAVVLQRLEKRTGGATGPLRELLGRTEAVQAAQVLMRNSSEALINTLDQFGNKAGAADRAFGEMSKSGKFQLNQLKAEVKDLGIALGEGVLVPALLGITSRIRTLGAVWNEALGNKATTPMQQTQNSINDVNGRLADLYARQKELRKEAQGQGAGLISQLLAPRRLEDIKKDIQFAKSELMSLKAFKDQLRENDKLAEQRSFQEAFEREQAEKKRQQQKLLEQQAAEQAAKEKLAQAKAAREQARQEQMSAQQVYVEATQEQFGNMVSFFGLAGDRIKNISKEIASVTFNALSGGVSRAFQNVGKALAEGGNAFQAFADGLKSVLADVASAIGDTFIKWGIANLVSGNVGMGSAQIAAGGALKILSGALGSTSGGGQASAVSGPSGGTEPVTVDSSGITAMQATESKKEQVNLSLNVEGSLVRESELSGYVSNLLEQGASEDANVIPSLQTGFS
jgi:TP901 family phage tail tape measure protein